MTVLARKLIANRLLAISGILVILGLLISLTWLQVRDKSASGSCAFIVPSSMLNTGRSFNSYVDRGDCIRLGRVSSAPDLEQGLSGREFMPQDEGLLFDFGNPGRRCMWMKDMYFSLDMVWLDNTKTINYIESNLSPQTYPKVYCGVGNAAYVIEINSGLAEAAKLKIGQKLNF